MPARETRRVVYATFTLNIQLGYSPIPEAVACTASRTAARGGAVNTEGVVWGVSTSGTPWGHALACGGSDVSLDTLPERFGATKIAEAARHHPRGIVLSYVHFLKAVGGGA